MNSILANLKTANFFKTTEIQWHLGLSLQFLRACGSQKYSKVLLNPRRAGEINLKTGGIIESSASFFFFFFASMLPVTWIKIKKWECTWLLIAQLLAV